MRAAAVEARRNQVGVPHEVRHGQRLGLLVHGARRRLLHDPPVVEDGHDVGQRERLLLIVRDEHDGRAERGQELLDLEAQAVAQARVERRERLVEQDQARLGRQGPRDGHALLLPAGELVRPAMAEPAQADQLEQLAHAAAGAAAARQPEADVLGNAEMREEQPLLRHVADLPAIGRKVLRPVVERLAVDRDDPGVGVVEARDQAEQRRLAGARRPEHRGEAARGHAQRDVAQHDGRAVRLGDAADGQRAHVLVSASASNQRTRKYVGTAEIAIMSAA